MTDDICAQSQPCAETGKRLSALTEFDPNSGCWLWAGGVSGSGYGRLRVGGKDRQAHRLAWELACGPIPAGLHVLHGCDTPLCINPAHLRVGTQAENVAEAAAKGRLHGSAITACGRGHAFTADNTYMRPDGRRECRQCKRLAGRKQWRAGGGRDWPISRDGPNAISDTRRWLASRLMDSKLTETEALEIVAHHPALKRGAS